MGNPKNTNNRVNTTYPLEWEKYLNVGYEKPEDWMRSIGDMGRAHGDRSWMYKNMVKPVLDVGCATSIDGTQFGEEYVGLDITPSFLRAARFVYKVHNLILADGRHLPIRDNAFKTAYAKSILVHYLLEDAFNFIEELCRVSETSYVVWSKRHMPSDEASSHQSTFGFWWFKPSLADLEKRFRLEPPKQGTSITEVNLK